MSNNAPASNLPLDATPEPCKPVADNRESQHAKKYIEKIKSRWNLPQGLEVEGAIGRKKIETLKDKVIDHERAAMKGRTLCTASVGYQNKPLKLYYDIKKV